MLLVFFEFILALVAVYLFNHLIRKSIEEDVESNPQTAINRLYVDSEKNSLGLEEDSIL
jgi:hypothetical protein